MGSRGRQRRERHRGASKGLGTDSRGRWHRWGRMKGLVPAPSCAGNGTVVPSHHRRAISAKRHRHRGCCLGTLGAGKPSPRRRHRRRVQRIARRRRLRVRFAAIDATRTHLSPNRRSLGSAFRHQRAPTRPTGMLGSTFVHQHAPTRPTGHVGFGFRPSTDPGFGFRPSTDLGFVLRPSEG